jgi:flavin reductase (DIM6/NTAB) family NADH-FMN oxidoreductase RutF
VVLLTTAAKGRANVMTMSWHMMVDFEPPLIACIVSQGDYSFAVLRSTGECVIAIPAVAMAAKVVKVGNSSGRDLDKFAACGLTPVPTEHVKAPLLAECFANLECKVIDKTLINRYNLFILEAVKAWVDPKQKKPKTIHHQGYGTFVADGPDDKAQIEDALKAARNNRRKRKRGLALAPDPCSTVLIRRGRRDA